MALLRGVNVGGKNIVSMADLREAFLAAGYESVSTYIQSGNVIFETDRPRVTLEAEIEERVGRILGLAPQVVVRSRRQMRNVVTRAPDGFGTTPNVHHFDVLFLKAPLTSRQAMPMVELRDGVDRAWPGPGVLYFARLSEHRGRSRMGRIVSRPEYQRMTIRNWNTTTRLLDLLDGRPRGGSS